MKRKELEIMTKKVLDNHLTKVEEYKNGKVGLLGLFTGEVMIKTKNQADPKEIVIILKELLK